MRYERDESSLRQKQDELDKARDDIAIAALEKQKQAIQDTIDALNEQKESIQEMMEESSKYYEKMIKEQEKMFDEMVKNLENTKKKWEELAEVEEISKAWGLVSEHMAGLGYTIEDVLNGNEAAFNAFKDEYVSVLTAMHSEDEHYLAGLEATIGKTPEKLDLLGDSASGAQEPVEKLGTSAGTASTNVSTLGTNASAAATGVGDLKKNSEGIADSFKELEKVDVSSLDKPLAELEAKITQVKNLINGEEGTSLKKALESLGEGLDLSIIVDAFTKLADAAKATVSAIGGGGADEEETFGGAGRNGKNGMPSDVKAGNVSGGTGNGLVGAIESVEEITKEAIGTSAEDDGENAIGSFNALSTAVQGVVDLIGLGGKDVKEAAAEGTLTASISSLLDTTMQALKPSEDEGVIALFSELAGEIEACATAANNLLAAIQKMQGMGFPVVPGLVPGQFTGTAIPHAEGTAKYDGDWGIKHNEKALTGELGPEILLRDGKYHILGKNGPEFVNLKKDDVILNHKQTEQVLSKKNQVGPSHAAGTLPNGFFKLDEGSSISELRNRIKASGLPTLDGIKSALQAQTNAIKSEVRNIVNSNTANTTVNQSNTFNISGVTGEEVAQKINSTLMQTFSGMSLNAYQRSMA